MGQKIFTKTLDALVANQMVLTRPARVKRADALEMAAAAPSNKEVLEACKAAYAKHGHAADQVTLGSVHSSQNRDLKGSISSLREYDWNSKVAAPSLVTPIYDHPVMNDARAAVREDGAFGAFFLGIQANLDVIIGGEGGVGVGFPFPAGPDASAFWMAYGGWRLALNIDIGVNINVAFFDEPPSEIAGDFIGIEVSAEPIEEGPEVSFGIHMSPDLSKVRGFSFGVGVALSLIPVTGAIVFGKITTSAS